MPCQLRLPRLCNGRHTRYHISRHAVTYRTARRLSQHVDHVSRPTREEARLAALKRLDETIDSDDLSATLEAHRDSNRASVIHQVTTRRSDPGFTRPSFIERAPLPKTVAAKGREVEEGYNAKDAPALADFSETVAKAAAEQGEQSVQHLMKLQAAAERAREQSQLLEQTKRIFDEYTRVTDFLRKHETPLARLPALNARDRDTFFDLIRRANSIIRVEQKKLKTNGPVPDLAPEALLLYSGVPRPFIVGLKGYPPCEPWSRRPKGKNYTATAWLSTEIEAFTEWMQMTPSEEAARAEITKTLIELVPEAAPDVAAEPFGSQTTGLAMPNSDIDMRVYEPNLKNSLPEDGSPDAAAEQASNAPVTKYRKQKLIGHLGKVRDHVKNHPDFDDVQLLESHFPLVKAIHKPTGLKVQLVAAKAGNASREAVEKYLEEFPHLKAIYLVMKTTLNMHGLSDPWHGGFGSYTLFMMCVGALKFAAIEHSRTKKRKTPPLSLVDNFIYVLRFWATFDVDRRGLSVEPPLVFPKRKRPSREDSVARTTDPLLSARIRIAQPVFYKPYLLALQDPADPNNDLGRTGLAIRDLQMTLGKLHYGLLRDLEDPLRKQDSTALLKQFVGRSERYFDEMRIPVDLWGSQFVTDEVDEEAPQGMAGEEAFQEVTEGEEPH